MTQLHAGAPASSGSLVYVDFRRRCLASAPGTAAADPVVEIAAFIAGQTGCTQTVAADVLEVLLDMLGVDPTELAKRTSSSLGREV